MLRELDNLYVPTNFGRRFAAACLLAALSALAPAMAAAAGPFSGISGTWRGDGSIVYNDGTREALHCRSDYDVTPDGNGLSQSMRCATASYSFRIGAEIGHSAGSLSGHWRETAFNRSGAVSGRARGSSIQANVQGGDFSASIAVTTQGEVQQYAVRSQGTSVSEVSIRLRRQ